MSPVLAGGFLTTGPPGKSMLAILKYVKKKVWKDKYQIDRNEEGGKSGSAFIFIRYFFNECNMVVYYVLLLSHFSRVRLCVTP